MDTSFPEDALDSLAPTGERRPLLVFFSSRRSGPARRMASLVAWVSVNRKRRLRVVEVDIDSNGALAERLDVSSAPALVLVRGDAVLDRLEGRATGPEIDRFLDAHLTS